jgi:N-acetylneuraminate epimerase
MIPPRSCRRVILGVSALIFAMLSPDSSATTPAGAPGGVTALASLPDPTGFAGMFAAVLDGKVWAGGGSQWDKPFWHGGKRSLSDRIYLLAQPDGAWQLSASRLPRAVAHFAAAAEGDRVYLCGGIGPDGVVSDVIVGRFVDGGLQWLSLPPLPRGLVYASGGMAGGRLFVVGGLLRAEDRSASAEVWSLPGDPAAAIRDGWRREPDLPSGGLFVAAVGGQRDRLYVMSGMGFDGEGKYVPSRALSVFSTADRVWRSAAALPEGRVGASPPCFSATGDQFLLVGGYSSVFTGAPREHPGFPPQTLIYDVAKDAWSAGPVLPVTAFTDRDSPTDAGPAPMVGAPAVAWKGRAIVVGGELRPSARSPQVLAVDLPGARSGNP